jgi:hypothetical protein
MQDKRECEFEAAKAAGSMQTGFSRGMRLAEIEHQCMMVRGYSYQ